MEIRKSLAIAGSMAALGGGVAEAAQSTDPIRDHFVSATYPNDDPTLRQDAAGGDTYAIIAETNGLSGAQANCTQLGGKSVYELKSTDNFYSPTETRYTCNTYETSASGADEASCANRAVYDANGNLPVGIRQELNKDFGSLLLTASSYTFTDRFGKACGGTRKFTFTAQLKEKNGNVVDAAKTETVSSNNAFSQEFTTVLPHKVDCGESTSEKVTVTYTGTDGAVKASNSHVYEGPKVACDLNGNPINNGGSTNNGGNTNNGSETASKADEASCADRAINDANDKFPLAFKESLSPSFKSEKVKVGSYELTDKYGDKCEGERKVTLSTTRKFHGKTVKVGKDRHVTSNEEFDRSYTIKLRGGKAIRCGESVSNKARIDYVGKDGKVLATRTQVFPALKKTCKTVKK